jgi:DNA-binding CsgD family transcriptional regulator
MISEELFRKTIAASYHLHRHRDPRTFPSCLARVLGQALGCDSALLVTVDAARREFQAAAWPFDYFQTIDRAEAMRLHAEEHPFVARCKQSRSVRALRIDELMPREQFLQTALYRDLYRPLGIEYQLLMLVASPDTYWRAVVLNRKSHDFLDQEQLALETLWPHIMLAQRNQQRGARQRETGAIEASAPENSGVIVITSSGEVTLCSEQARIWLAEYFGALFLMRGVTLPTNVLRWARLRVERESLGRGLRVERRDPLVATQGERCLVLDINVDHGKNMHLITLEELALNAPPPALEALGLTPREAEVMSWVAQGKTNREVGLILGSAARTVDKHLEHIFQKLGVESRTAAILRAWQAARFSAIAPGSVTRPSNPR